MICWLMFVVFPRWAAIGVSALKRASSSCAWPRAAIVPIVSMSCFLMRAAASIGLTLISAYILPPPCAAIRISINRASSSCAWPRAKYIYDRDSSWRLTVLNVVLV
ncbi:hypothetical protein T492DRAFT_1060285 [Pavlovales sp. CCMP2436]|nr:hypothetical protein T492DRAFT_1060285 [Pavlovales sp. CCMP2436]